MLTRRPALPALRWHATPTLALGLVPANGSRTNRPYLAAVMSATWKLAADSPEPGLPRSGHASAALPQSHAGDLITFGGYTEDGQKQRAATNEAWIYRKGQWEVLEYAGSKLPQERLVTQAEVIGDNLFIIGGWDPGQQRDGGKILDDVWKLNLRDYSWTQLLLQGPKLQPTSRHQAVAVGSCIYIHNHRTCDHLLRLDAEKDPPALSSIPIDCSKDGSPASRGLHTLTAVGNKLYIFGGAPQQGDMLGDLWRLDLDAMAWEKLKPTGKAPHARCSHTGTAIGSKIYFFGGSNYKRGGGLQPLNDLFILDCANLSWQWPELDESSAPLPRNAHIAADISGKSLLIHGGWNPFQETYNDTQILNIGDLSGV